MGQRHSVPLSCKPHREAEAVPHRRVGPSQTCWARLHPPRDLSCGHHLLSSLCTVWSPRWPWLLSCAPPGLPGLRIQPRGAAAAAGTPLHSWGAGVCVVASPCPSPRLPKQLLLRPAACLPTDQCLDPAGGQRALWSPDLSWGCGPGQVQVMRKVASDG